MKTKIFLLFFIFISTACNEAALYKSMNPPMDGAVIEGDPNNNISGFYVGVADPSSPHKDDSTAFLTLANRDLATFCVPISPTILDDTSKRYGVSANNNNTEPVIYVYKPNGRTLERDNYNYNNGVLPSGADYNLDFLRNELYDDILVRGFIPLNTSKWHKNNYLYLYLQLKKPLVKGESLQVCSGELLVDKALINPDCYTVNIP